MIESGGLRPSAVSARVQFRGEKVTAVDGSFAETEEVVGGFAIFEFKHIKEAVESARTHGTSQKIAAGLAGRPMFDKDDSLPGGTTSKRHVDFAKASFVV